MTLVNNGSTPSTDAGPSTIPSLVHGPMVGECTETSAVVWYRDARPESMVHDPILSWWPLDLEGSTADKHGENGDYVDGNTSERFSTSVSIDPKRDYVSKTRITDLLPATEYRILVVAGGGNDRGRGGRFKTPGSAAVSFAFGSCIGGQNYGRNTPDHDILGEGFPIFRAISALRPKLDFIHFNGDFIYADDSIERTSTRCHNEGQHFVVPDGLDVMPIATDLEGFRARYRYTHDDPSLSALLSNVAVYNTWDDHEIDDDFGRDRLIAQGKEQLYRDGVQACFEYWPVDGPPDEPQRFYRKAEWGKHVDLFILDTRTYRAVHTDDDLAAGVQGGGSCSPSKSASTPKMSHILGPTQLRWLLNSLSSSRATWKFVATSVPLSYPTGWPRPEETGYDGWSDGSDDTVSGPEREVGAIFDHVCAHDITGVIFLSGDVHFPFAHSYDPFGEGRPLAYEICATPFHALCLPPPERGPDRSFNPTVLFVGGELAKQERWLNFGHVTIKEDGHFRFNVRNVTGESVYELKLPPPPAQVLQEPQAETLPPSSSLSSSSSCDAE